MAACAGDAVTANPTEVQGSRGASEPTVLPFGLADVLAVGAIVAFWLGSVIVIDPAGDFPLNDDWAYGLPVKWLVETGRLRFTDWQFMTLVTQVLWGALFASVAGFSFTVLRISTLVIAAVGLVASYLAGREVGLQRSLSTALAALFVVNPVFITVANSFHTDVHFLSLTMLGLFLLLRGIRRGEVLIYCIGWIVVLAATLVRQVEMAIPIGLVVGLGLRNGLGRAWLVKGVLPTLMLAAVVAAYPKVVQATIGLPAMYYQPQDSLRMVFAQLFHLRLGALKPMLYSLGCGLMHLGWWTLPLVLLLPPRRLMAGPLERKPWLATWVATGGAVVVTTVLWMTGRLMPVGSTGSYLVDLGTGPRTMAGDVPHAPTLFWVAMTAASGFGATWLILALTSIACRNFTQCVATRELRPAWLSTFLITAAVVYYIPFSNYGPWFDRYALPEMALLGLLIASEAMTSNGTRFRTSPPRVIGSATLALVYLGFGIFSAHDYIAWNRSRWEAGRSLTVDPSIVADDIDGGFEFNAWYSFRDRPGGTYRTNGGSSPVQEIVKKSIVRDRPRFVLSFSERKDYTVVRGVAVDRWLPLTPDRVLILVRKDEPPPSPTAEPR
jgi:hypothetical protein